MIEIQNLAEWLAQQQTQIINDTRTQIALQQTQAYIGGKTHVAPAQDKTYLYGGFYPMPIACCTSGPEKTNCCNCGASLKGKYRCEYCDTVNL